MDVERLLRDYNVPIATSGKHSTEGWVNVHCPFCKGSKGYHLGIRDDGRAAHCWRCGTHPVVETLSHLLGLPERQVRALFRQYRARLTSVRRQEAPKVSIFPLKYPEPNAPLTAQYKAYIEKRGFDADEIERVWDVRQTGPISTLDGISYSHRILIPIKWGGEIVSFQARDITNKSDRKYMACPKRREKIHHKNIVYCDESVWRDSRGVIVVEGVTDVWRLGKHAVATFGIEFKMEQVLNLARLHDTFHIVFDDEPQAQKQARKLATKLRALGKQASVHQVEGDPGSMSQQDARHLVRTLLRGDR